MPARRWFSLTAAALIAATQPASAQDPPLRKGDIASLLPGLKLAFDMDEPEVVEFLTWRSPLLKLQRRGFTLEMHWNGLDDREWPFSRILDALLDKACGPVTEGFVVGLQTRMYATASLVPAENWGGNAGTAFRKTLTETVAPAASCCSPRARAGTI